jgi:hypothetical protein
MHVLRTSDVRFQAFMVVMFPVEVFWNVMLCTKISVAYATSIFRVKLSGWEKMA